MKKKFLAVFAALFVFGTAGSFAFDWSQCWCNYGGGIEEGDWILHVDTGLGDWVIYNNYGYDAWTTPYLEVGLSYAGFIGKLPFTFGGFVGFDGHGYRYSDNDVRTYLKIYTGGDIAYHLQLPPKIIDLYGGLRAGVKLRLGDYDGRVNVLFDPYIGVNFFFTDFFGLNVETGYENWLRAGLSFKF